MAWKPSWKCLYPKRCTPKWAATHFTEASAAKYVVQQYVASAGGHLALSSMKSMYAVGQVKMQQGDHDRVYPRDNCEVGGFVLWQKNPDLWYFELVVSGFKVSAGSDAKVAWNQSSSQPGQANRGPPRPLRRFLQVLLAFFNQTIHIEFASMIFTLWIHQGLDRLETSSNALKVQSSAQTEMIHHTIWGYFSQRTGLFVKFEDKKLVRMKPASGKNWVFWETRVESVQDYRYIDGINIAHSGKTTTTFYRYGKSHNHKRKVEETWSIDEVDFNVCGLSNQSFLPPADLKREQEEQ
ncbi:hypothetical protein PTKIN_Ptkin09bG0122800 [Pterospermum kingtungense]